MHPLGSLRLSINLFACEVGKKMARGFLRGGTIICGDTPERYGVFLRPDELWGCNQENMKYL